MGRLNVPQVVMDPTTSCTDEACYPVPGECHLRTVPGGSREMHNVAAQLTINDDWMSTLLRLGVADIVCSHRRSGGYDGIEYPQYCRDTILRLTLRADNGSWVYRRSRPSSWFRDKATHWRWPD